MKPQVSPEANIKEVIVVISENMLGATAVLENEKIVGVITDGDIRRMLTNNEEFIHLTAKDIMSSSPKTIANSALAVKALELLQTNDISQVLVEEEGKYVGVVHLHNLVKEGII
jgi:arabinose-5-phosphate isomerase